METLTCCTECRSDSVVVELYLTHGLIVLPVTLHHISCGVDVDVEGVVAVRYLCNVDPLAVDVILVIVRTVLRDALIALCCAVEHFFKARVTLRIFQAETGFMTC